MYDEIEGISQDTVITCFEGGFRSRMMYTELQLKKFASKVALAEGSAQESQFKKKKRYSEVSPPWMKREEHNSKDEDFHFAERAQRKLRHCYQGEVRGSKPHTNANTDNAR